jgi:hypothetical protein
MKTLVYSHSLNDLGNTMDLVGRRTIEKRIILAAAEGLIEAGCSVSVVAGEKLFLSDCKDPSAIYIALYTSGEPGFQVRRVIGGVAVEGWVDFVGENGIEVIADKNLGLHSALEVANGLALELNAYRATI